MARLQRVRSELAEIEIELHSSRVEAKVLRAFRDSIDLIRMTTWALHLSMERPSAVKQRMSALVMEERLRRACELNINICKDFEAGRVQLDQHGLSLYLMVLDHVIAQLDFIFGSREASLRAQTWMPVNPILAKTALIVDDVDVIRHMIRVYLESLGMEVMHASSAAQAVVLAESFEGKIDLLLTDIEMPGGSGWECAHKISARHPDIRIVYMSGGFGRQEWELQQEKPANAYFLQKPFRLAYLRTLLVAILSK